MAIKVKKSLFIIVIISVIIYFIIKLIESSKTINKTLEEGLETIKNFSSLEEIDIGGYKKIFIKKIFPFYTTAYLIKDLGYLAILSVNIGIFQEP